MGVGRMLKEGGVCVQGMEIVKRMEDVIEGADKVEVRVMEWGGNSSQKESCQRRRSIHK